MIKSAAFFIVGLVSMVALIKSVNKPKLKYFKPSEFGVWYPLISDDLLLKLDKFREVWGYPVVVSGAEGGIGRHSDGDSQHSISKWGEVRAVDVFPMVQTAKGLQYVDGGVELMRAYQVAREIGFTGVGVYVDTRPGHMLHLDVRAGRSAGDPAKWARVSGEYVDISRAFV